MRNRSNGADKSLQDRIGSPLRRRAAVALLTLYLPACLAPVQAGAVEKLGEAAVIKNTVTGSRSGGGSQKLAVSDPVYAAEKVSASANSHGEIVLTDQTRVIVGENSTISLDDFVVGESGFSSATVKVTKGAFRFITGNSPKKAFKIVTPMSSIGVRGTTLDVYVNEATGNTRVLLLRGAITVCSSGNACIATDRSCDIIEVKSPSEIEKIPFLRSARRPRSEEAQQYGLTENQSRFQRQWRAPVTGCGVRAAEEARSGVRPDRGAGSSSPGTNAAPAPTRSEPDTPNDPKIEG